ncbi:class I SAM-dependent methyltransferase [Flammeovirga sp. MY04]|uniref:class I SAM-dependent methyltransferase n=1 Tax=Flammeovirga sp. MY04 TaxID=1191459 RepID=UPI0008061375|nr:class I SAM-dependent methyltransferase [Flammeovirga sp. MY04]ANQ50224.1 class I SAM-dependent methyltransferase [Flammeovirga sp. MY04]
MSLEKIDKTNLFQSSNGIFYSKKSTKISYPEDGNKKFSQIEDNSYWFKHRNDILIPLIKSLIKEKHFIDIGGGNGFVSKSLQENDINVTLIEPGRSGVQNAQERGVKNIICATFEDIKFEKDNIIEAVGLFDVIEHINEDDNFLKQINEQLCDNSYIFITVPAYNFLSSNEDIDAGHYRRYTLQSLTNLLKKNNFEIKYKTYFFSFLILPILLFRTIPSLLGFNKNSKSTDKHKKEHKIGNSILMKILDRVLCFEVRRIRNFKYIPFGSSCLIIGQKKKA